MPHRLVASIAAADVATAVAALRRLPPAATHAEIRFDALWPEAPRPDEATDAILALTDAGGKPLIATLRPVRQGGGFSGDEGVRLGLLLAAARAGFALVDIEGDVATPALLRQFAEAGVQVIVSQHTIGPTPCRDDGLRILTAEQDAGGVLDKFAFASHSYADTLRALELACQHNARGGRPAVSIQAGPDVRALMAIVGNHATYGHAPGLEPASPGQPPAAAIAAVWERWGLGPADLSPQPAGARPWLAVLGTPLGHSLSPRLHNAALRAAARPERYGALEVPASPGALLLTLHAAQRIGLAAASVSAPHKRDAARIATCDATAKTIGAANCLKIVDGVTTATNTDATALRRLLEPHIDAGAPAVVLGSGGMGRAAIWALRDLGAAVRFTSRDPQRAKEAAALGAKWTPWEQRGELRAPVWIQATSIGMKAADAAPVPATQLRGAVLAVEANYGAGPTAFQAAAAQAGAAVLEGRKLLLEQAADAWQFWFGRDPDRQAMQRALPPVLEASEPHAH